jgi:hypothetical protein
MAAAAGWYGDPTQRGRLRYWDGWAWTQHVSEEGGTGYDPIVGPPPLPPLPSTPAPPASPPASAAPPTAPGAPPARDYPPTAIGRAGFGVAALGGVLGAASAGSTAVEQEGLARITVAGGSWIGAVGAVLCIVAAVAPWPWARLAGVGVSSLFALLLAFAVIGFRTSDDLVPGVDVSLGTAGWLMLAGSVLLFAGTALALAGLRRPAAGPDPAARPREGKGVASLVLGIIGVVMPVTAAPAVGLGLFALDDTRASGGRVGGRGMAVAGLVLGIVSLSLWGAGLLLGMLLAQP